MKSFLIPTLICLLFLITWIIKSPRILYNVLTFYYRDEIKDTLISLASWLFVFGALFFMLILIKEYLI